MGAPARRAGQLRLHPRLPSGTGAADPDLARRGQLLRRSSNPGRARTQWTGRVSLLRAGRPGDRRFESQRFRAEHRRHLECARQRGRHDAASRTSLRALAWRFGRPRDLSFGDSRADSGRSLMAVAIKREQLDAVALNEEEYRAIVRAIGRGPNDLEIGMFGALWSEHCAYKTSKALLRQLPTEGPHVLQGPGENAGAAATCSTGSSPASVATATASAVQRSVARCISMRATPTTRSSTPCVSAWFATSGCAAPAPTVPGTSCSWLVPTPGVMGFTARPSPRWRWTSGRRSAVPPSRSAIHFSRSCCAKRACDSTSWRV